MYTQTTSVESTPVASTPQRRKTLLPFVVLFFALNGLGWLTWLGQIEQGASSASAPVDIDDEYNVSIHSKGFGARPSALAQKVVVDVEGIDMPTLFSGDSAQIPDYAQVIGVEINGEAHAYLTAAMMVQPMHGPENLAVLLVNDVVGNQPICISRCDITRTVRVFSRTGNSSQDKLSELRIGGWDKGMVLIVDGERFHHLSPTIPLSDVSFVGTTWKRWREAHPDTLIYKGNGPSV